MLLKGEMQVSVFKIPAITKSSAQMEHEGHPV
jgi:hypothetical protein